MLIVKFTAIRLFIIFLPLIFCGSLSVSAYSSANGATAIKSIILTMQQWHRLTAAASPVAINRLLMAIYQLPLLLRRQRLAVVAPAIFINGKAPQTVYIFIT